MMSDETYAAQYALLARRMGIILFSSTLQMVLICVELFYLQTNPQVNAVLFYLIFGATVFISLVLLVMLFNLTKRMKALARTRQSQL